MKSKVKMKAMHRGKKKSETNGDFLTKIVPHRSFTPILHLPYLQLHSYSCSSFIKSSLVRAKPCKCCEQNTRFHQPYSVLFTVVCNQIEDEAGIIGSNQGPITG
jgi:hypothetical protein